MSAPVYRFLPWARRGLAQGVANPDNLGPLPARTSSQVNLDVATEPATSQVDLYGPGEVTGIDRRLILRTEPAPGATDFEPNYLAAIEFDPPDFPWLFTPAAHKADRLRPWCVLVVVEKKPGVSLSVRADSPLPVLTIAPPAVASQELPELAESWAWAHTQILEDAGPTTNLDAEPERNLSRLICPRRLKPETRYMACVVPAFDLGVAQGLGRPVTGTQVNSAWKLADVGDITLPVYYFWEFSTAVGDDIESMARRLHGPEHAPPALGQRRIHVAAGHKDIATPPLPAIARSVTMHGALRPVRRETTTPDPVQPPQLTSRLAAIVARRTGPELPAPLYGEWPAAQHALAGAPRWMTELNTTVAHRIAAALGTEVVRRNQEAFVQAAWDQVGEVREANELAERARLAAAVLERMVIRQFAPRPQDRLLQLAGPALRTLSTLPAREGAELRTIAAELDAASVPAGAASPAYRRLASGQRQAVRLAARTGLQHRDGVVGLTAQDPALAEPRPGPPDGVTDLRDLETLRAGDSAAMVSLSPLGLNGETSAAEIRKLVPLRDPVGELPSTNRQFFPPSELAAVTSQATGRPSRLRPDLPPVDRAPRAVTDTAALNAFAGALRATAGAANEDTPVAEFVAADVVGLGDRLLGRLDARSNVARRVSAMVSRPDVPDGDGFDPYEGIQAFPVIGDSTYQYLDQLPGGWLLPEANGLEPDTAIVLRTNPTFTSAFLAGLNHEMNSELLWRGYPTDQRGTPFQHFWGRVDDRPDIRPIHRWAPDAALGAAGSPPVLSDASGDGEQIVLLLRGTLLRRYPDLVIYATKGTRTEPGADVPPAGRPIFFARLQPDISLVGFSLLREELESADWWFVLEQQLTAPRFGFDYGDPPSPPAPAPQSWSDATWSMFDDIKEGQHIRPTSGKIASKVLGGRRFGATADQIAGSLLQRPIRVALHRDRLRLKDGGGT